MVNLRATMLDEPGWFVPFVETFRGEGLLWARTPALHSFEAAPPMAAWRQLAAEFAGWDGRPAPTWTDA